MLTQVLNLDHVFTQHSISFKFAQARKSQEILVQILTVKGFICKQNEHASGSIHNCTSKLKGSHGQGYRVALSSHRVAHRFISFCGRRKKLPLFSALGLILNPKEISLSMFHIVIKCNIYQILTIQEHVSMSYQGYVIFIKFG